MGSKGPEEYLKRYYVSRIDSVDRVVENPDPRVQNPSGYSQVNLMQKVRFKPNQNWDINYAFHYSETSEYARYDRLIETQANGLPRSAVWKYGPQIWSMNNLSISKMGNSKLFDQATLRLALQTFEESRIDRNFSGGQRFRLRTNLEEVKAYSANLDFVKEIEKHKFFYGLESVLNDVVSTGTAIDIRTNKPIAVPDRYPASTWKSNAAYLNYQFSFAENLFLQGGLRYNTFKIKSDFTRHLAFFPFDFTESTLKNAATTGSLGLVYLPSETWKISLNGSTGFRAPNVDDIGKIFDFTAGDVIVPNTNLKAEFARNVELNISKIFGDVLKFDVSGFYTYLDNAMVRRAFQVNGQSKILYNGVMSNVFAIQNAAFAKVYGINANLDLRLPAGFIFSTKYNYQLGKEEMDNGNVYRSRHAAPAFGVVKFGYQKDGLVLQLYTVFNAEVSHANLNEEERQKPFIYAKDADGKPFSPGWKTLNFKAMHKISQNWAVSAGLENITDQRYRPYSSGLVAPGRNFVISLDAKF
jgi:hemoglobin/transferrin/lactoferrin receptor protein